MSVSAKKVHPKMALSLSLTGCISVISENFCIMYKIIYRQLLKSVIGGMRSSEKQDWPLFHDRCKVLRQENTIRINQLLLPTLLFTWRSPTMHMMDGGLID